MAFQYIGVEEARIRNGLRMVVVGSVPSPWGEAAKGILHIKGIEWAAVRLVNDSEPLKEWAGQRSGPVAIYDNEPPRSGWVEILLLAERLAPTPPLLPTDPAERAPPLSAGAPAYTSIPPSGPLGGGLHRWSHALRLSPQTSGVRQRENRGI